MSPTASRPRSCSGVEPYVDCASLIAHWQLGQLGKTARRTAFLYYFDSFKNKLLTICRTAFKRIF